MNKKVIIQIVIIVGAFGAAGFVLYNGLFKSDSTVPAMGIISVKDNEKILPYGSSLDFKNNLFKRDFQFGSMSYPKVDPNEVGVPDSSLISPSDTAR